MKRLYDIVVRKQRFPSAVIVIFLGLMIILGLGCDGGGGGGGSGDSIVPDSGPWSGSRIFFNVSSDGTKITAEGSPYSTESYYGEEVPYCLRLSCTSYSGYGTTTITSFSYDDIPIDSNIFETSKVSGEFSSATQCEGTMSLISSSASCSSSWDAIPESEVTAVVKNPRNFAIATPDCEYDANGRLIIQIEETE